MGPAIRKCDVDRLCVERRGEGRIVQDTLSLCQPLLEETLCGIGGSAHAAPLRLRE